MALPRPRAILFDFGDTLLREGPVDVFAGVEAVLALATETGGTTARELADALTAVLEDLEPRRRSSQLELPTIMTWRLVYEPRGVRFDTPDADLEWAFWKAATTHGPEMKETSGVASSIAETRSDTRTPYRNCAIAFRTPTWPLAPRASMPSRATVAGPTPSPGTVGCFAWLQADPIQTISASSRWSTCPTTIASGSRVTGSIKRAGSRSCSSFADTSVPRAVSERSSTA